MPESERASAMNVSDSRSMIREAILPGSSPCLTCSFQIEGMVLLHMVRQQVPNIPVLFIDTGYHFQEVYDYRDRMAAKWKLNLVNLRPRQSVAQQEAQFGVLHQSAPDRCCALRKVEPLFAALEAYDVWFAGLRRQQSPSRATLEIDERFVLPSGKHLRKISPLARWSAADVWTYAREHGIPELPLYDRGYTSIGCEPCTSVPVTADDLRSGRWGGRKLECGIHIDAKARTFGAG